jgi:Mitochondrial glycoprotein
METLSQELHEAFYGFIEKELGINDQILEELCDYCMDKEQQFYIEWLKDLKSII